jgi:hypothetical protein
MGPAFNLVSDAVAATLPASSSCSTNTGAVQCPGWPPVNTCRRLTCRSFVSCLYSCESSSQFVRPADKVSEPGSRILRARARRRS